MAIKVIHRGTPKLLVYKGKCDGCSSVMDCEESDLRARDTDETGPFGLATCPVCMPRLMNVTFRPKADYDRLKEVKK